MTRATDMSVDKAIKLKQRRRVQPGSLSAPRGGEGWGEVGVAVDQNYAV